MRCADCGWDNPEGLRACAQCIARAAPGALGYMPPEQAVGLMIGTPLYMAPEPALGKTADARSDLYGLGAVLYEMAAGRPPFIGDDILAVIYQHVQVPPEPPARFVPNLPLALNDLILKLLAKTPERRPANAAAVREELRSIAARLKPTIITLTDSVMAERPDLRLARQDTVSILFTDIENSTVMTERLGDLQAQEVLHDHNAIIRKQVAAHRGFEIKSIGDGFMIAFASARQALLCAAAIQRAFATYGRRNPDHPIRVRMGLHTGEAIREADDFYGKTVIVAARIADQARGGETLVSATFRDVVESSGDFRFDGGRDLRLKGLTGVFRVYSAIWSEAAGGATPYVAGAARDTAVRTVRRTLPSLVKSRATGAGLSIALLAAIGFGAVYLYRRHASAPSVPSPARPAAPSAVAPLEFERMTLELATRDGVAIGAPRSSFTDAEVSAAHYLTWAATFKNKLADLEGHEVKVEARFFNPDGVQIASSATDLYVAKSLPEVDFSGVALMPPLTGLPAGRYKITLSSGDWRLAQESFFVTRDLAANANAVRAPAAEPTAAATREDRQKRESERLALEERGHHPLELRSIELLNTDKRGAPLGAPGTTFDFSSLKFVGWRVTFDNRLYQLADNEYRVDAGYTFPNGRSDMVSDSQNVSRGRQSVTFSGRIGNANGGAFLAGTYGINFLLDGKYLAHKEFTVLASPPLEGAGASTPGGAIESAPPPTASSAEQPTALAEAPAASGCSGAVLFEDEFKNLDKWPGLSTGDLRVDDGNLVIMPDAGRSRWRINQSDYYRDVKVCVDVNIAGTDDLNATKAGVSFWASDARNMYVFLLAGSGFYQVAHVVDNQWVEPVLGWTESNAIKRGTGEWNRVELDLSGESGAAFVNGARMQQFVGRPLQGGGFVGLVGVSPQGSVATLKFRDIRVTH